MNARYLCIATCFCLFGCDADDDDLRLWIDKTRQSAHPVPVAAIPPWSAPTRRYEPGTRSDPFAAALLNAITADTPGISGPQPDLRRSREPLEAYPLASLRLIGSLRRNHDAIALIEADRRVHPVRVGSHLGQDFGKVVAIGERAIDIDELVSDSSGRWMQRRVQLTLQEIQ